MRKAREGLPRGLLGKNPGGVLLSHTASRAVPSAPKSLTSEFGMGSGVASSRSPPETCQVFGAAFPGKPLLEVENARFVVRELATRILGARLNVCLRDMIKPHDRLVQVSSVDCSTSTPCLSTS